jgi:hypothetical protein
MAEGSQSGEGRARKVFDMEELLKNLDLHGEELNDVILGKEEVRQWPEVKWLAAAKVLTNKSFSMEALKNTMLAAWSPAREVTFHAVEANLFVLQAFCLGDWNKITQEGPWLFRGCALMVEHFDGATMAPKSTPKEVQAWIQIHKIPPLFRNKTVLEQLARRVGKVHMVELAVVHTSSGDFHRARVLLDSTKPLTRFVPLTLEGQERMFLQIKYEKLPKFCDHCGMMGHTVLECGTGEFQDSQLQFGAWMVAEERFWRPGTPGVHPLFPARFDGGGRGRGSDSGRGGGSSGRGPARGRERRRWVPRGSNLGDSRKRGSAEAGLDDKAEEQSEELADTGSSPLKGVAPIAKADGESSAKKHLNMAVEEHVPPPPPAYVPPKELKRQKRAEAAKSKSAKGSVSGESEAEEAASVVEGRQMQ